MSRRLRRPQVTTAGGQPEQSLEDDKKDDTNEEGLSDQGTGAGDEGGNQSDDGQPANGDDAEDTAVAEAPPLPDEPTDAEIIAATQKLNDQLPPHVALVTMFNEDGTVARGAGGDFIKVDEAGFLPQAGRGETPALIGMDEPGWQPPLVTDGTSEEPLLNAMAAAITVATVISDVKAALDYTAWPLADLRAKIKTALGDEPAAAWSREDILLYLQVGAYPAKTQRGNWVYDSRRTALVTAWTADELLDFVEGRLKFDTHFDQGLAWEEAYRRYKAPPAWTHDDFREYVCTGVKPDYTASGLLVNDRQRDNKRPGHLTFKEIRGALLGEIEIKVPREELMAQYRLRMNVGNGFSDDRLLQSLASSPTEVSMDNTFLVAKLEEYKTAMTRNEDTLSEATAGQAQAMLYKAVRALLKREFNEFNEGWNLLLDFVNENYAALFDPYKARRGWSQINLNATQLRFFEDLMSLVIATRDPIGRSNAARAYNLEVVMHHLPEENERQNLQVYYAQ